MLRLRQVAFASPDLHEAEGELAGALGLERCYRDPGVAVFGLENALFPVGDQFLEIVSPSKPGTTAGRLLEKRGGDTGYMAIFQVDDLAPVEQRLEALGTRVVFDAVGDGIRGLHLHPKDVDGAIVSIDAGIEPAEWPWAGPSWREHVRTDRVSSIVGMTVATPEPDATCRAWSEVLGLEPGERYLRVDDARVDFAPPSGGREGIVQLDFETPHEGLRGEQIDLLGVTIRLSGPR